VFFVWFFTHDSSVGRVLPTCFRGVTKCPTQACTIPEIFIKSDIEKLVKCYVYEFWGHPGCLGERKGPDWVSSCVEQ
jgi:hypothetical protein